MAELNEGLLRKMMRDPRYQNSSHPEYESHTAKVRKGFEELYGNAPARTDATGRLAQPQPKPTSKSKDDDWQMMRGMIDGGAHTFRVNGPVRVGIHSDTLGQDGVGYRIDWQALDPHGRPVPNLSTNGTISDLRTLGTFGLNDLRTPDDRRPHHDHEPPFENPYGSRYGYQVRVHVPPQPTFNGNSASPYINVFGRRGRILGPAK